MKHSDEKGRPSSPEKKLSISPILTYYHYQNDEIKNEKEFLIKTKLHLKKQNFKLNSKNDIEFEYY
jgi:hypothetical protein